MIAQQRVLKMMWSPNLLSFDSFKKCISPILFLDSITREQRLIKNFLLALRLEYTAKK